MKLSERLAEKTVSDGWEWPSNCNALRFFPDGRVWHMNWHFVTEIEQTEITGTMGICRHEDYLTSMGEKQ